MKLIGLIGFKCSGKDTIADFLVKNGYKKMAFADNLRNILKVMFNWDSNFFTQEKKESKDEEWGVSPRLMMQLLGTEFIRNTCSPLLNSDIEFNNKKEKFSYHIKKLFLDNINLFNDKNSKIVISDVRFPDEVKFIKWLGGDLIKVNRNITKNEFSNHESEKYIDSIKEIDYEINNNKSIQELYDKISNLLL